MVSIVSKWQSLSKDKEDGAKTTNTEQQQEDTKRTEEKSDGRLEMSWFFEVLLFIYHELKMAFPLQQVRKTQSLSWWKLCFSKWCVCIRGWYLTLSAKANSTSANFWKVDHISSRLSWEQVFQASVEEWGLIETFTGIVTERGMKQEVPPVLQYQILQLALELPASKFSWFRVEVQTLWRFFLELFEVSAL